MHLIAFLFTISLVFLHYNPFGAWTLFPFVFPQCPAQWGAESNRGLLAVLQYKYVLAAEEYYFVSGL